MILDHSQDQAKPSTPPTAFSDTLAGTALGALSRLYNVTVEAVRANENTREPKRSKAIRAAIRAEIENSQLVQDAYNDWALPAWLALVETDMRGASSAAGGHHAHAISGHVSVAPAGGPNEGGEGHATGASVGQRSFASPPSPVPGGGGQIELATSGHREDAPAARAPNPPRRGGESMRAANETTASVFDSYKLPSGHVLGRTQFHVLPRLKLDHAEAATLIGLVQDGVSNPDPYKTPADYLNESDYEAMIKAAKTGPDA